MAELLLTHGYFLREDPREFQFMKSRAHRIELQSANHLIKLRRPKREKL
jgi:hypothetical protein